MLGDSSVEVLPVSNLHRYQLSLNYRSHTHTAPAALTNACPLSSEGSTLIHHVHSWIQDGSSSFFLSPFIPSLAVENHFCHPCSWSTNQNPFSLLIVPQIRLSPCYHGWHVQRQIKYSSLRKSFLTHSIKLNCPVHYAIPGYVHIVTITQYPSKLLKRQDVWQYILKEAKWPFVFVHTDCHLMAGFLKILYDNLSNHLVITQLHRGLTRAAWTLPTVPI